MRLTLILLLLSFLPKTWAQDTIPDFTALDSLYREDQFYVGITYNILQQRPEDLRQNKFSLGFSAGFLRDMPINEKRTVAIAAGLGYSFNSFNHNLQIARIGDNNPTYGLIGSGVSYDKNKMTLHYVDLPIEIRWRTSTMESHRFWRIYGGLKLSYLFYDTYKFDGEGGNYSVSQNPDFNKVQYGTYLSVGYNTWNAHVYYGLNPLFKSAELDAKAVKMNTLNIGLMFYIL